MGETLTRFVEAHKNLRALTPTTQKCMALLDSMLAQDTLRIETGMHFGEESKRVAVRFDAQKFDIVELLHITDVQFGHVECRYHRVKEYRDWVLAKPNRFMLWGGDMVDAAHSYSPGMPWENFFEPQSQIYRFVEMWAPARHRIIGYVGGNHERRGIPVFGDLGRLIATLLRVPYSGGQQLVDVHFGTHKPFKIHLWHGTGGARTAGAKMQLVHRFMQDYPGSQLYLVGHLHDSLMKWMFVSERRNDKLDVHMRKVCGAMSSSFLSFWGTYAEAKGLSASDVMMARAILEASGRWELTFRAITWFVLALGSSLCYLSHLWT